MLRPTPTRLTQSLRRLTTSIAVVIALAAGSTVPGLPSFTPAAAASPWDQIGLDIDGAAAGDQSGFSVAMSDDGTRLAVGAIRDDGGHGGYVRVYQWTGTAWSQMGTDVNGQSTGDEAGFSVALSANGTRLAVGARLNDDGGLLAGHVRVFDWSGTAWEQLGDDIDGEAAYEQSGYSVSLSSDGTRLALGAPSADANRGLVRVFTWSGAAWTQLGDTITGDAVSDTLGWSVSLSDNGSRLAVGAPGHDAAASNAGRATVYAWSGSAWTVMGSVDGEAADDFSARSVALSADGARLAVGAAKNDGAGGDAGHVRVYSWSGGAWTQLGPDVDGEEANDQAGRSVALSADGSRLAVGAADAAEGAGKVRVFVWSGSSWVQDGQAIEGEAIEDQAGAAIALSADGAAVAIGATRNDDAGENAGHVRVGGALAPTPTPGPPTGVVGVAADEQVTVTWAAPEWDGGYPITGYTVTATPGGDTCTTSGALTCTVLDLLNGTAYRFSVTATNVAGTGPASDLSGFVTPAAVPGPPFAAAATVSGEGAIAVWWSAPADDGGTLVTGYTVTATPDDGTCSTTGELTCTVSGLAVGTEYTFEVTATNAVGTGPTSAPTAPITAATAPGAPTDLAAVAGDAEADVSWAAPADDGGAAITSYTVTSSPGGVTCSAVGDTTCRVTGLINDVAYVFTATATNGAGSGPASEPSDPVTPTGSGSLTEIPTEPPTDVTVTPGDGQATVTWSPPGGLGNATIVGYTVTANPGGATCTTTGALSCTITGLTNGVTYSFTVTVTLSVGGGTTTVTSDPVTPGGTLSGLSPCPSGPTPFTDIGDVISAADVACILGLGITTGTSSHTYSPERNVDRDQMASFLARLWRAAGLTCPTGPTPFTDIDDVISQADIACILGLGITTGTSSHTYSPERNVDRDQMASFLARLWRAAGLTCPLEPTPFSDIGGVISQADVACILELGITTGTSSHTYSPERSVDRDQMASFLARLWRALGAA